MAITIMAALKMVAPKSKAWQIFLNYYKKKQKKKK